MGDAPHIHGPSQDPQHPPPIASGHPNPAVPKQLPGSPPNHHPQRPGNAFSSQFDMAQSSANRAAAFNMSGMSAALPPVAYNAPYHPGGPPQQAYAGFSAPVTSQMQQPPQYAIQGVPVPSQAFYTQQGHPMQAYYPMPVYAAHPPAGPAQPRQNVVYQQAQMPPNSHPQVAQAQPAAVYYYPSVGNFANPVQPVQHIPRQYGQLPQGQVDVDPRMASSPIVSSTGSHTHVVYDSRAPRPRTGNSESDSATGRQTIVRGPPRKPKQRGHAIWIGNLPPHTDLMSLVNHVCREAPGLESLFLISKSNCAFANFKDEQACAAAQQKLHDSRFQTVRLVSRLRKATVEKPSAGAGTGASVSATPVTDPAPMSPLVSETPAPECGDTEEKKKTNSTPADPPPENMHDNGRGEGAEAHERERYFVLKSLTVEDLDMSVRNGIWATQSHNEETLSNAYKSADNVYLVFSANKSGEYFGYARMTSSINEDPEAAIEFAPAAQITGAHDLPKAIPTEATEHAPKGRIIDDSARGTIFWEAERDEAADSTDCGGADEEKSDGGSMVTGADGDSDAVPKSWGKPFTLEWVSTARVPFYRTRGLRNPWNANREVKIARDGTELEPSIGRRLIGLFNMIQNPGGPPPPVVPRPAMGPMRYPQGPARPFP